MHFVRKASPVVGLALVLALFTQGPAFAAGTTKNVSITNFMFTPATVNGVKPVDSVRWTNNATATNHTSTSDIGWWDSGTILPAGTFTFPTNASGTFTYHCSIHLFMTGTVAVVIGIKPNTVVHGNPVTVAVGKGTIAAGFVIDVQKKDPGGVFTDWMIGITNPVLSFTPTAVGTYQFRSLLRNTTSGLTSGFSPVASLTST